MKLKLILIFQILPLFGIYVKASYQCIDCRGDRGDHCDPEVHKNHPHHDCLILTGSGYSCGQYKFKNAVKTVKSSKDAWSTPNPTNDLSRCIPKDLNITENNIEICCVWSKELGCQILVKPGNEYTCGTCRSSEGTAYDFLEPCPCNHGSPIRYRSDVSRITKALHIFYIVKGIFGKFRF